VRAATPTPSATAATATPSPSSTVAVAVLGGAGSSAGPGDEPTSGGGTARLGPRGSPGPDGPLAPFLFLSMLATAGVGGLLLIRRRPRRNAMPKAALAVAGGDPVALGGGVLAMAMAPLGPPPVLRPALIISQVLFDPAEFVPDWAKPRPKAAVQPSGEMDAASDAATVQIEPSDPAPEAAKPASRPRRAKPTAAPRRRTTKRSP
jgi:hypothetical protein